MKNIIVLLILIFISFSSFILVSNAQTSPTPTTDPSAGTLPNPLGSAISTPQQFIGKVISGVLGVVGSLALAMFIYGGLVWMTAAGNKEKVEKGKSILLWAVIGLVVIFSAYALVRFVFTGLLGYTAGTQG
jgi:hypothetical protein